MLVECIISAIGRSVQRALRPFFEPRFWTVQGIEICDGREGRGKGKREGKIKALSRDASYVIVCTFFFRETLASSLQIREIFARELQLFRALSLSRCQSRHRYILKLVRSA